MAGTIVKIKQSAVAGRLPTHSAGSTYIEQGELALNTADQKLYSKDASGTIFEIGGGSGGAAGSNEIVTTDFTATNNQTIFTVAYSASNDHVNVYYNGVKLSPDEYTNTNGTTVVLDTGATTGATISIEVIKALSLANGSDITEYEFTATSGQTTFTISDGYSTLSSDIEVYVNGVKIPSADFTANNDTTVVLGTGAAVNDQVAIRVIKLAVLTSTVSQSSETGAAIIPAGTTAQRDVSPDAGYLRWNSSLTQLEIYNGSAWVDAQQLTAAEVKTAYESNSDTNEFSDAEQTKLSNIETSADVTDAINVASAGAVMEADTTTSAMGFVVDEDNMVSDLSTKVPTQQSVKAYVDTEVAAAVTASDLDFQADSGGALAIDLDSEVLTFTGGTGITTVGNANDVSIGVDSTIATLTGSQILTSKTLTSPVLNTSLSGTAFLDEDNLASDSATKVASQQSIKAYVDTQLATQDSLSELSGTLDDITDGTTYKKYSATEKTKLSNIETSATADQTGAEIKTLYEAESSAFTDALYTKLSNIETSADVTDTTNVVAALTAGTGITIASNGTLAVGPVALTTVQVAASESAQLALTAQEGDVVVRSDEKKSYMHNGGSAGTIADYTELQTPTDSVLSVGGYTGAVTAAQVKIAYESNSDSNEFSDAEQTKLNAIESSATADQTAAEIKTAYESNSDTNEYSDAEQTKLSNIETSADVTDSTNVASAGAVMESDTTTALMSFVVDEDTMSSNSNTKLSTQQAIKAYVDNQINLVPDAVAMAIALG